MHFGRHVYSDLIDSMRRAWAVPIGAPAIMVE